MTWTVASLAEELATRDVAVRLDGPNRAREISGLTQDSRRLRPGDLFCALRGVTVDGHDHIDAAVKSGATAVLVERAPASRVATLLVADSKEATGHAASILHGDPSRKLDLVGVTGTNGKTTIVTVLAHVTSVGGHESRSMGTLTGSLTTAAAPEFQAALRGFANDAVRVVAAEVSSHALDQHRVSGSRFRVGIFSNLTQDHLDYHSNMDSYFDAKARLFTSGMTETAVIDVSTDAGRRMAEVATCDVVRVDPSTTVIHEIGPTGSRFDWRGHPIRIPLAGRFNIANALLVAEAARLLGIDESEIAAALASVPAVPGRFEWVDAGQPFGVVVDYSHTPASIEAAVDAARQLATGRVLLVFGAGGDRDAGKRPSMGAAASAADLLFVTSDNPRTEDPEAIIDAVLAGVDTDRRASTVREPDRRDAIRRAVAAANPGDIVVIAGKGHEDYQIIGTNRTHFDDREEVTAALSSAGWTRPRGASPE